MRPIIYNPETEPLAPIIEIVLTGEEVELPVTSIKEGEYIRQRLSNIFKQYKKTHPKWKRPFPHLVMERWNKGIEIGGKELKGEWKIKVNWTNERVKYKVVEIVKNLG